MNFDDWFWELEGDNIRAERFWNDVHQNKGQEIIEWMKTAYRIGYEEGYNNKYI